MFEKFLIGVVVTLILSLFILISFDLYKDMTSDIFELSKNDWECTKTVTTSQTFMVLIGKVQVPQTRLITSCVQYNLKEKE